MPSPFDALDAALSSAVLSSFGEDGAQLRPRTRSEFTEGADGSRPARSIRGVFSDGHGVEGIRGAAMGSEFAGVSRLSVQMAEFWISQADLSALPYAIRKGDQIALTGRPGVPVYDISDMQNSEVGGVNLILVASQQ